MEKERSERNGPRAVTSLLEFRFKTVSVGYCQLYQVG